MTLPLDPAGGWHPQALAITMNSLCPWTLLGAGTPGPSYNYELPLPHMTLRLDPTGGWHPQALAITMNSLCPT